MKTTIAIILAIVTLFFIATATAETYEVEAVVMGYEVAFPGVWEVTAVTRDGDTYSWYADNDDGEYWHIGDLVVIEMFDYGDEEDDEVMDVIYCGELAPVMVARWLKW